jgi:hypothetical protein
LGERRFDDRGRARVGEWGSLGGGAAVVDQEIGAVEADDRGEPLRSADARGHARDVPVGVARGRQGGEGGGAQALVGVGPAGDDRGPARIDAQRGADLVEEVEQGGGRRQGRAGMDGAIVEVLGDRLVAGVEGVGGDLGAALGGRGDRAVEAAAEVIVDPPASVVRDAGVAGVDELAIGGGADREIFGERGRVEIGGEQEDRRGDEVALLCVEVGLLFESEGLVEEAERGLAGGLLAASAGAAAEAEPEALAGVGVVAEAGGVEEIEEAIEAGEALGEGGAGGQGEALDRAEYGGVAEGGGLSLGGLGALAAAGGAGGEAAEGEGEEPAPPTRGPTQRPSRGQIRR